jgi:hypothetical protein
MGEKNEIVVVCAFADAPLTVPGSDFSRVCSGCSKRLMVAPSGQQFIEAHPSAVVICLDCAVAR